ncbi:MAG: alpha/beta fold hydrolase [Deltaproteobacteria bacterium]|nr:alpha/beta fold hydrolase [Deltaproteobacteria bacterium]
MRVVLLPGFLWTPGDEAALVEAGLPVHVAPLTTLVDAVADVAPAERAARLAAALSHHGDDVVVGYSMGARVLLAALSAGLPTRAAVLVSLSSTPPADRADRARLDAERARALVASVPDFVDAWGALPLFADAARSPAWQAQQRRRRRLSSSAAAAHAATLTSFSSGTLVPGALDAVAVPVTLLAGGRDASAVRVARATAAALPQARVAVEAGVGHVLPLEAPGAVVAAVMAAVTATSAAAASSSAAAPSGASPDRPPVASSVLSASPRRTHVAPARS